MSGNIATGRNDPGLFRQAAFEVSSNENEVTLTLTDPETGYFLGAVRVTLDDNMLVATVYDAEHENDGDEITLYDWEDAHPYEGEPDET